MDKCVFWGKTLAVCWTAGWFLSLAESHIRCRLDVCGLESTFTEMMRQMHKHSSRWCVIYIVICIVHIGLLVVPLVGFAWAALTSVM